MGNGDINRFGKDAARVKKSMALQRLIDAGRHIVFFGGAGVSTESGIPDFRSSDGLYRQACRYPPEEVVSHDFFCRHPEDFFAFYKEHMLALDARPNPAHKTLAALEHCGRLTAVITQNIDGLHQRAGSRTVYELHGSIHRNACLNCGKIYGAAYVKQAPGIPRCLCGGIIKPDVVLYGESLDPYVMQRAAEAIRRADTLIIGGTSLAVYPAAGFIRYFRGKTLVVINRDATPCDEQADLVIREPIGQVLGALQIPTG